MDTDDDIFIIHKKATAYIDKLKRSQKNCLQKQQELMNRMLSCQPPHGHSEQDWEQFGIQYDVKPQYKVKKGKITYKECKDIIKECEFLEDQKDLEVKTLLYDNSAKEILDHYKQSINNIIHTDFMSGPKQQTVSQDQIKLRDDLIVLIEHILGLDAVNQIITRKPSSNGNGKCFGDLEGNGTSEGYHDPTDDLDDDWNGMVYNDLNRINLIQKFKYDKRQHFSETIKQYQGLQNCVIPQEVLDAVIDMIEKHGLANTNEQDPKKRYVKVTKAHIRMFLSESDLSDYYEDQHLIYSMITNNPCPNIQKYEKALYQDFDALCEVFCSLPQDILARKNLLNSHYILRQLLMRRGVHVPDDDLNNIKTPSRARQHDDIYQICCEKLGWNFTPLG